MFTPVETTGLLQLTQQYKYFYCLFTLLLKAFRAIFQPRKRFMGRYNYGCVHTQARQVKSIQQTSGAPLASSVYWLLYIVIDYPHFSPDIQR